MTLSSFPLHLVHLAPSKLYYDNNPWFPGEPVSQPILPSVHDKENCVVHRDFIYLHRDVAGFANEFVAGMMDEPYDRRSTK